MCRSRCRSPTTPSGAGSAPVSATSTSTARRRSSSTPRSRPSPHAGRRASRTAAAFAEKRLAPYALEWDANQHFPVDELREAAQLGMAAIYCRDDVGGSALRRLDGVRIFEQLAIADPTTAAFLSIHNMCAWMIDTYGTPEQRKSWVPRLAAMEAIASYCLTEPGAGSDASAL